MISVKSRDPVDCASFLGRSHAAGETGTEEQEQSCPEPGTDAVCCIVVSYQVQLGGSETCHDFHSSENLSRPGRGWYRQASRLDKAEWAAYAVTNDKPVLETALASKRKGAAVPQPSPPWAETNSRLNVNSLLPHCALTCPPH